MQHTIEALAQQLLALRTPEQIRDFRRRLDKPTAQAVIRSLGPVDRGAILLCLAFEADGWKPPFTSEIIDLDLAELNSGSGHTLDSNTFSGDGDEGRAGSDPAAADPR